MDEPPGLDVLVSRCALEPISTPGAIQPHGAMLAVAEDRRIEVVSANAAAVLGIDPADLLGRRLADVVGSPAAAQLGAGEAGEVIRVAVPSGACVMVVRRIAPFLVIEIERDIEPTFDGHGRLLTSLRRFHGASSPEQLVQQAARTVQDLTGFDRVMIYRFDDEWNGEVVAEALATDVEQFVGLRFPASDIPPQARALYSRARLRLIPDATAAPCRLLAVERGAAADLDLTDVALRAVSPVHLQYLANMGVRASMSVAIHDGDRLWGLIACHHLSGPLCPTMQVRDGVDLVGRTTSTILAALLRAETAAAALELSSRIDTLTGPLWAEPTRAPMDVLADVGAELAHVIDAIGVAVVRSDAVARFIGGCPPPHLVAALIAHVRQLGVAQLAIEELGTVGREWADLDGSAAGALAVRIGNRDDAWLVWFRPETMRVVRWGGDPSAKVIVGGDRVPYRLDPRSSFAEYRERVRGRSTRWTPEQIGAAGALGRRVAELEDAVVLRRLDLASAIQRTVMLESFPPVPSLDGAARYVPSAGHPIGGDWYDVFFDPRGHPVIALGDVAGHGLAAAATMAQVRHALRAYVVREETAADAMDRLNEMMLALLPNEMATAVLVVLDPATQRAEIVNAGHYPPMLVDAGEARLLDSRPQLALGVRPGRRYASTSIELRRGTSLVLYTDGLIERRDPGPGDDLVALVDAASRLGGSTADELCESLLVDPGARSDTDDDTTVVALRFIDDPPGPPRSGSAATRSIPDADQLVRTIGTPP